jgi:hypothetical protein
VLAYQTLGARKILRLRLSAAILLASQKPRARSALQKSGDSVSALHIFRSHMECSDEVGALDSRGARSRLEDLLSLTLTPFCSGNRFYGGSRQCYFILRAPRTPYRADSEPEMVHLNSKKNQIQNPHSLTRRIYYGPTRMGRPFVINALDVPHSNQYS